MTGEEGALIRKAAASMAHEVRNAVAGLAGTVAVLDSGTQWADLPPEVTEQFRIQIARIRDSVDELLAWANPSEQRLKREEIHALIESALRRGCLQGTSAAHQIVRDYTPAPVEIQADAARLTQALRNVIRNSCQSMPQGGSLQVRTSTEPGKVVILLSDSGPGIPAAIRERAFEPFFTTKATGTGLGLPVVRRIVEAHGGEVAIESSNGSGTIVRISLPTAT